MTLPGTARCIACKDGISPPIPFSMAFQPVVDTNLKTIYAYEALVRGTGGEGAQTILDQVTDANRYAFDQNCRVRALTLAAKLQLAEMSALLAINFIPGAIYNPASCIKLTLETAAALDIPTERVLFEITEHEKVIDRAHLHAIVNEYRALGFKVAIDDFGSGSSDLDLLADLPCDLVKLDMTLTRNLDRRPRSRKVIEHMVSLAHSLGSGVIAEGIETIEEYSAIRDCGVKLMQGFLFARPGFEHLPDFTMPPEPVERVYRSSRSLVPASSCDVIFHRAESAAAFVQVG